MKNSRQILDNTSNCEFLISMYMYIWGARGTSPWDRCYDYLNIFAEKIGEKIGVFDSKQS
jgi:hypothetical protein